MSIFSKRNRNDSNSPFQVTITTDVVEDEIRQRTKGELPMADIGNYISPSGGYLNYAEYKVVGTNSSTGRKNTRKYSGKYESDVIQAAIDDGLSEPFELTPIPFREPTERQLSYALDLGASIPSGACFDDVSAIIGRIVDDDEAAPPSSLSLYADKCGARFSKLIGEDAFWGVLFYELPSRDLSAFYAYSVYCKETHQSPVDILNSPYYNIFYQFADVVDDSFAEALKKRTPSDLAYPHGGTKIYKIAFNYLRENGLIEDKNSLTSLENKIDVVNSDVRALPDKKQELKERIEQTREDVKQAKEELCQSKINAKKNISKSKEDLLLSASDAKENLKSPVSPALSIFFIIIGAFILLAGLLLTFTMSWVYFIFIIAGGLLIIRGVIRRKR